MMETGLSLSGGSLRGAAHIGVLNELQFQNIDITHIAGTSAGALIAGLYACGMRPEQMEHELEDLSIRKMLDIQVGRKGWVKGKRIYEKLVQLTNGKHFSDLDIPLAIISLDLISGQLVIIKSGEVAKAIHASIAIPGIFAPVKHGNQLLVDGYILNNNPVDVVKDMGAQHITAVSIKGSKDSNPKHIFHQLSRYIGVASKYHTSQLVEKYADLIINIDLQGVARSERKSMDRYIELGRQQACGAFSSLNMNASESVANIYKQKVV
ncbi:patatin-like phospholipase family protein [Cytobacillus sp. IB215316]|uniref:patatin-like phospholipase family protein n=1 Tax=Cytobacillus sp. IB215316 TaxID=3097354 RepID=UPI002A127791|nr:patatin-like phospholipase family protein [Cytobacillus sp. IB215316]MDX8362322.1 patatin-like phospholipase family protein [Cytobacillus sp. IB215316]